MGIDLCIIHLHYYADNDNADLEPLPRTDLEGLGGQDDLISGKWECHFISLFIILFMHQWVSFYITRYLLFRLHVYHFSDHPSR